MPVPILIILPVNSLFVCVANQIKSADPVKATTGDSRTCHCHMLFNVQYNRVKMHHYADVDAFNVFIMFLYRGIACIHTCHIEMW